MSRVRLMMAILIALLVSAVWAGTAFCQAAGGGGGRGGRGGGGGFDPAAMRQRMMDQVKQELGASDQEWTALQPLVEKVMTVQAETRVGGGMRGMGGRGGRGGQPAAEPPAPTNDVERAAQSLRTVLENQNSTPQQVTDALTAYRKAREKAEADLTKAQEDLKAVVTPRQEAQLVLRGLLK